MTKRRKGEEDLLRGNPKKRCNAENNDGSEETEFTQRPQEADLKYRYALLLRKSVKSISACLIKVVFLCSR